MYRDTPLVILARTDDEALEPWQRINHRRVSLEEFRSGLIQDDSFTPSILLIGKSITQAEIGMIYRPRAPGHISPVKAVETPAKSEVVPDAPIIKRGRGRPRKTISPVIPDPSVAVEVMTDIVSEVGPDIVEKAVTTVLQPESAETVAEAGSGIGEILSDAGEAIGDAISSLAEFIQFD